MRVPIQHLQTVDAWSRSLHYLYGYKLIQAPWVSQNLLVVVFGVLLYIILSILSIVLWVFVIRPLFKKTPPKPATTPQVTAVPVSQIAPAPALTKPLASEVEPLPDEPYGLQFVLDSGEMQSFSDLPISIGRSEQNNLVLDDETVSAEHARIYFDELVGELCITDLDSLNGLFINDQPTHKNILRDGARIRLGSVPLVFRSGGIISPASAHNHPGEL